MKDENVALVLARSLLVAVIVAICGLSVAWLLPGGQRWYAVGPMLAVEAWVWFGSSLAISTPSTQRHPSTARALYERRQRRRRQTGAGGGGS